MRRILLTLALVASLVIPATASAATKKCTVDISPSVGSPTDVYRITVSGVPLAPEGFGVEVRAHIKLLGTRTGSVYFAFLMPGITEFFIDHNLGLPGEPPPDPLAPGRYLVMVTTPHIHGACMAVGMFVVRG